MNRKGYIKDRWRRLKSWAVAYKGGKCKLCGYNRCVAALEFHHRNPSEKEASWTKLRKLSIASIKAELDKCDLLCACCHREEHFNADGFAEAITRSLESSKRGVGRSLGEATCVCGKTFRKKERTQTSCSRSCVPKPKKYGEDKDFIATVKATSITAVAKRYGVSHRFVSKRYHKLLLKCI